MTKRISYTGASLWNNLLAITKEQGLTTGQIFLVVMLLSMLFYKFLSLRFFKKTKCVLILKFVNIENFSVAHFCFGC